MLSLANWQVIADCYNYGNVMFIGPYIIVITEE